MAEARKDWGVTEVVVRYYAGEDSWEVSMDPAEIDILVFNWERFRRINGVIGRPLPPENHLKPDGAQRDGKGTPAEEARKAGLRGPPRRVGPRQAGTTGEPMCIHNRNCSWWCIDEGHEHPPE